MRIPTLPNSGWKSHPIFPEQEAGHIRGRASSHSERKVECSGRIGVRHICSTKNLILISPVETLWPSTPMLPLSFLCPYSASVPSSPQSLTKMASRIRFQGKCLLQGKPWASEDIRACGALCTQWNLSLHSNPLRPPLSHPPQRHEIKGRGPI